MSTRLVSEDCMRLCYLGYYLFETMLCVKIRQLNSAFYGIVFCHENF